MNAASSYTSLTISKIILGLFFFSITAREGASSDVPRLFVIGDSTAASYPSERYPLTGWAQVLQEFFDQECMVVENRARSGRSSKSFMEEGAWKKVIEDLGRGGYVLIQFGHNDSKAKDPKRYTDPESTYQGFLKSYIRDTRSKEATPILLTPINRNSWADDDATLKDTHGKYPDAMRAVAREMNVPLIDLHVLTKQLFESYGHEKTNMFFMILKKGRFSAYPEGLTDNTHLQERGARAISQLVAGAISRMEIPLKEALIPNPEQIFAFPGTEGFEE